MNDTYGFLRSSWHAVTKYKPLLLLGQHCLAYCLAFEEIITTALQAGLLHFHWLYLQCCRCCCMILRVWWTSQARGTQWSGCTAHGPLLPVQTGCCSSWMQSGRWAAAGLCKNISCLVCIVTKLYSDHIVDTPHACLCSAWVHKHAACCRNGGPVATETLTRGCKAMGSRWACVWV